ncbi:MAG: type III-B CRISPR module-associated protein Cmr3 [Bernardetiaceae bacterium]|nr:type III-B CRISPR module-associated protein Cmr3 [Bernardetiaceae bacterium]
MMIIQIEALDTLFFRDGKPFEMGDDTWASGIFPPPPSVFYGALRSAYFAQNMKEFAKANTGNDPSKSLEITKIYLGESERSSTIDLIFPTPLDLVYDKNVKRTVPEKRKEFMQGVFKLNKLSPQEVDKQTSASSSKLSNILTYSEQVEEIAGSIITKSQFDNYLVAGRNDYEVKLLSKILKEEPKIGIARNNETNISSDGALYRITLRRMGNIKFYVEFAIDNFKTQKAIIKLGGEGKTAVLDSTIPKDNVEYNSPDFEASEFKLYLFTPAIFKKGWLPEWLDENTLEGNYNDVDLVLTHCAIGKPENIGGFNMVEKQPKYMRKAVPAGSVYYFKTKNGQVVNPKTIFAKNSICDEFLDFEYHKQGFGLFYLGKI